MYELRILLTFLSLLAGFGGVYALVHYLRHQSLPAPGQFAMAMLLGFSLLGLACTLAGFYLLWAMHAVSPLTLLVVGLPFIMFVALTTLALYYMRSPAPQLAR